MTFKKTVLVIFVLLFAVCGNILVSHVSASAHFPETVFIQSDGSVTSALLNTPVYREGDTYFLNATITLSYDLDGLVIRRDNMTFNGQGYSIIGLSNNQSESDLPDVERPSGIRLEGNNILIENVSLTHFYSGILIYGYYGKADNVTVSNSTLTENQAGAYFSYPLGNPTFIGNNITNNINGIVTCYSEGLIFYHNNFIDNQVQVLAFYGNAGYDSWDAGYPVGGNYWSDYHGVDQKQGPNQNVNGSDGIGDTWYSNDSNNVEDEPDFNGMPLNLRDHYPLMNPYSTEDASLAPELPSTTITVVLLCTTFIIVSVLVWKKKRVN